MAKASAGAVASGDLRASEIIATAERLFFERGYRGVSIRDLAAAVGIQISSLYYYFPSKDEILLRIIRRHLSGLLDLAGEVVGRDAASAPCPLRLAALIRAAVVYICNDRMAAGISNSQARDLAPEHRAEIRDLVHRYESFYVDLITEGISAGEFIPTDPVLAAYLILGAQIRLSAWFRPSGRLSAEDVAGTYSRLLVRSLEVSPGQA